MLSPEEMEMLVWENRSPRPSKEADTSGMESLFLQGAIRSAARNGQLYAVAPYLLQNSQPYHAEIKDIRLLLQMGYRVNIDARVYLPVTSERTSPVYDVEIGVKLFPMRLFGGLYATRRSVRFLESCGLIDFQRKTFWSVIASWVWPKELVHFEYKPNHLT